MVVSVAASGRADKVQVVGCVHFAGNPCSCRSRASRQQRRTYRRCFVAINVVASIAHEVPYRRLSREVNSLGAVFVCSEVWVEQLTGPALVFLSGDTWPAGEHDVAAVTQKYKEIFMATRMSINDAKGDRSNNTVTIIGRGDPNRNYRVCVSGTGALCYDGETDGNGQFSATFTPPGDPNGSQQFTVRHLEDDGTAGDNLGWSNAFNNPIEGRG